MSDVGANNSGFSGQQQPTDDTSSFNMQTFLIKQLLGKLSIATLVKVIAVTNDGTVSPVGFVDVQPLVNLIDGQGNASPRGQVFNIPYFRLQGGANAVIIDPQVGDIGIMVSSDRDLSSVKANKAQSNPGSLRRFDMADGLYIGGFLNGTPTQYIQYNEAGITIHSPVKVLVEAPLVEVNATDAVIHGSHSVSSDINGYGSRTTFEGGSDFTIDSYTTGAVVTSHEHGWTPPKLPDPT